MGIEHAYGKALQDWAQGQAITMPPGVGKSANQRAQHTALTLAIAFQDQAGLPEAIAKAKDLYQRQLDNGHMALADDGGLNEYMIPDVHAFIWYAAMATLHELAWHRLDSALNGVKELRDLSFQWWQHHLSMCSVTSVPADQTGAPLDQQVLAPGSVVSPGARANGGRMSYHRDAIYRRRFGIPQVGQALRNPTWWTPKAPDLVGPYWVSRNLDTLPQTADIGPDSLPMLSNPMTIQRYTLGFRAFFADGVIPTAAFSPTVRSWMDYSTWQTGFTLLPDGPADPEPDAPWPGDPVEEYKVAGKAEDPMPEDPPAEEPEDPPADPPTEDPAG
ncbi:MAG: hypothetical protein WAM82_23910 [Thermoanaerobaculia bacterium]